MRRPNHKPQLANIQWNSFFLSNHRVRTEDTVLKAVRQTVMFTHYCVRVRVKVSGYRNFYVESVRLNYVKGPLQRDDEGKTKNTLKQKQEI